MINSKDLPPTNNLKVLQERLPQGFLDQFECPFSVALNFSFSYESAWITSIIPANHKLGLLLNQQGQIVALDKWTQYTYATTMSGPHSIYSLVDIYHFMLGVKGNISTQRKFTEKPSVITVHPFASQEKKIWHHKSWAELLLHLTKDPSIKVNIVGSNAEKEQYKDFLTNLDQILDPQLVQNLVGKTNLPELSNILQGTDLLIAHDSMVSHLASVHNINTLVLGLGPVRPAETVPYNLNALVVNSAIDCFPCPIEKPCDHFSCKNDITPKDIVEIVHNWDNLTQAKFSNAVEVNQVLFKERLFLDRVFPQDTSLKVFFSELYNVIWPFLLETNENKIKPVSLNNSDLEQLLTYKEGIEFFYELTSFGSRYADYSLKESLKKEPSIEELKKFSNKLSEIDNLSLNLLDKYPLMRPIVNFYHVRKSNLPGENISEISSNLADLYREFSLILQAFYELIEQYFNTLDSKSFKDLKQNLNN